MGVRARRPDTDGKDSGSEDNGQRNNEADAEGQDGTVPQDKGHKDRNANLAYWPNGQRWRDDRTDANMANRTWVAGVRRDNDQAATRMAAK